MSHNESDNSLPAHEPIGSHQPLIPPPHTQQPTHQEPLVALVPESIDEEAIQHAIHSASPSSDPFSLHSSGTGDASIDMSSGANLASSTGAASDTTEGSTAGDENRTSTPSKRAWTVKGLLSSIREKVQEPSDASAPVSKFYYDNVNVFQGLHDISDSDSDGEDAEISPRSDPDTSEPDGMVSLDSSPIRDPSRQRNPPRRRRQQSTPDRGSLAPSAAMSKSYQDVPSSSSSSFNEQGGLREPAHTHRGSTPSPLRALPHSFSESSIPPSRRRRSSSRHGEDDEDWDSNRVPLELEGDESQHFLPGTSDRPERSRQERLARRAEKNKWYQRLWRQVRRQQTWVFLLVLGISAAILGLAMEQTMHLMILGRNKLATTTSNYFVNYMLWVLFSMASCLIAAFLVHFVAPYSAGSGIPAVKSILSGVLMEHYLSLRTLITKVLGLVCVIAAGLFVGKEGPYVHISTALASQLARLPFFAKIQRNEGLKLQLFAAGCAAGVAVTFGAPIGGVIFSIEVTTTYYLIQNLSKGFFCAIVATLFIKLFDAHGLIRFFSTDFQPAPYTSYELLAFSLIGITFGLLGVLFNKYVKLLAQLRRNYKIFNTSRYGQVLVIAMISALVTFPILPLRLGASSVLNDLFSTSPLTNWQQPNVYFLLSAVVVLEFVLCGVSVGLPVPCGLYTPMFILGAALGRLVGEVLQAAHILPGLVPAGYAVVGAAAFAAGTTRTLSSSIICFELTRQLEHLLPVLLAVLIASAVGSFFGPSIYDELLKMKGLPYMPPFKSSQGGHRTAKSIMRTDVLFLTTDSTFEDVQNMLIQSHYGSFPLVQSRRSRTLLGIIPRRFLERTLDKLETQLSTLAQRQIDILNMALQDSDQPLPISTSSSPALGDPPTDVSVSPAPFSDTSTTMNSDNGLSSSDDLPTLAESVMAEASPVATKSVLIEPSFKSRFGGLSASLHLDTGDAALPESQKIQLVMQELTRIAMAEKVGFSRATPGLDAGPFQLPVQTPHSKVHFLFAMLGLNAAYIVDQGELVGVVTKRDLISLQ